MLKIKADKMKDLEKFGFEDVGNFYRNKKYTHICKVGYSIYKILVDKNGFLHFNVPTKPVFDLIYDLIKANMVEKVVEDEQD